MIVADAPSVTSTTISVPVPGKEMDALVTVSVVPAPSTYIFMFLLPLKPNVRRDPSRTLTCAPPVAVTPTLLLKPSALGKSSEPPSVSFAKGTVCP